MTEDLLESTVAYLLSALHGIGPDLSARTPCHDWDLRMLLAHVDESIAALREGLAGGQVWPTPTRPRPNCAGSEHIRARARALLGDWAGRQRRAVVISAHSMPATTLATVGALELTVHAWDLTATGPVPKPIPGPLACELLGVATDLVPLADRSPLFAPPLPTRSADASDRLLAYLGRPS